jgi:hypothetical protein
MVEVRRVLPCGRPHLLPALAVLLALVPALAGCILTADKLDPALDVPNKYTRAKGDPEAALPPLAWWRGFRSTAEAHPARRAVEPLDDYLDGGNWKLVAKFTEAKAASGTRRHMQEAFAAGDFTAYLGWFERAGAMAKALPYQSPQLRAIAVAHAPMTPSPVDLSRLSDKQLEQLRRLIQLAGPSNIAGGGRADERDADPLAIAGGRPGSPSKSRSAALGANGRRMLRASGALAPLRRRSVRGPCILASRRASCAIQQALETDPTGCEPAHGHRSDRPDPSRQGGS